MRPFSGRNALIKLEALLMLAALPLVSMADEMAAQATNSAGVQPAAVAPAATNAPSTNAPPPTTAPVPDATSLYGLTLNSLDGKPVDLRPYMGHVALVINTASKSGHAEQFAGLEKLYQTYKDKGFVILAFPSNDFGQLEPGPAPEIAERYTAFLLTFPVFEMVKVRGNAQSPQSPVYHLLTTGHSMPTWNFHKYLVDKTGHVIGEFPSQTKPDDKNLLSAIEAALK